MGWGGVAVPERARAVLRPFQASKRELAEAILGEDKGLIASLSREDLELLVS